MLKVKIKFKYLMTLEIFLIKETVIALMLIRLKISVLHNWFIDF